jgi:hypothetical protein
MVGGDVRAATAAPLTLAATDVGPRAMRCLMAVGVGGMAAGGAGLVAALAAGSSTAAVLATVAVLVGAIVWLVVEASTATLVIDAGGLRSSGLGRTAVDAAGARYFGFPTVGKDGVRAIALYDAGGRPVGRAIAVPLGYLRCGDGPVERLARGRSAAGPGRPPEAAALAAAEAALRSIGLVPLAEALRRDPDAVPTGAGPMAWARELERWQRVSPSGPISAAHGLVSYRLGRALLTISPHEIQLIPPLQRRQAWSRTTVAAFRIESLGQGDRLQFIGANGAVLGAVTLTGDDHRGELGVILTRLGIPRRDR